ncbi:MAG: hypothetical protein P4L98_23255 [Ancalomicrobiaceae bacterium]|nr:hypothetical protein [Ancalomicrobiaceae bacterium]
MTETDARSSRRRADAPRLQARTRAAAKPAVGIAKPAASATTSAKTGRAKTAKVAAKPRPVAPAGEAPIQAVDGGPARRTLPWSEIRSTYEDSSLPVAVIAKAYGVRERAIYERAAQEGWAHRRGPQGESAGPAPEPDRPELDRSVLVSRLFRAVERQIDEIDRRLTQLQSDGVDERDARTLAALAKTLELLIGLERQTRPEVVDTPEADIDAFRRDLARRIQSLQATEGD